MQDKPSFLDMPGKGMRPEPEGYRAEENHDRWEDYCKREADHGETLGQSLKGFSLKRFLPGPFNQLVALILISKFVMWLGYLFADPADFRPNNFRPEVDLKTTFKATPEEEAAFLRMFESELEATQ